MSKAPTLTAAEVRAMLDYDPETGVFTWRHRPDMRPQWNARYAGKRAGYEFTAKGGRRYRAVRIHDWPFVEQRLAWLYVTGAWPVALVDHWDNDGVNNRWDNLREASKRQNAANSKISRANTTGYKGVNFHQGRFRATIRSTGGKQIYLGSFDTAEAAAAAYEAAAKVHFGEYARVA